MLSPHRGLGLDRLLDSMKLYGFTNGRHGLIRGSTLRQSRAHRLNSILGPFSKTFSKTAELV